MLIPILISICSYTRYIYIYIMKGVRSSTFPCANVPTLEGTRSTNVTGIEPLFLVSRLLTCIMTDVMADYLNGLHNGLQTLENENKSYGRDFDIENYAQDSFSNEYFTCNRLRTVIVPLPRKR